MSRSNLPVFTRWVVKLLLLLVIFTPGCKCSMCGNEAYHLGILEGEDFKEAFPVNPLPTSLRQLSLYKNEYYAEGKNILQAPRITNKKFIRGKGHHKHVALELTNREISLNIEYVHHSDTGCYRLEPGAVQLDVRVYRKVKFLEPKAIHVEKFSGESLQFTVRKDDILRSGLTLVWVDDLGVEEKLFHFSQRGTGQVVNYLQGLVYEYSQTTKTKIVVLHGLQEEHSGLYKLVRKQGKETVDVNKGVHLCVTQEADLEPVLKLITDSDNAMDILDSIPLKPAKYLVTVPKLPKCISKPKLKIDIQCQARISYEVDGVDHMTLRWDSAEKDEMVQAVIQANYPEFYQVTRCYGSSTSSGTGQGGSWLTMWPVNLFISFMMHISTY